jgi:hypothetical protein
LSEWRETFSGRAIEVNMYFSVKKVEPRPNFELLLTFEDGAVKKFDMKPLSG